MNKLDGKRLKEIRCKWKKHGIKYAAPGEAIDVDKVIYM
jgi:hypothetical protein